MEKINSIFDIVGPIMIGPSSSHTAGAVRLGALARNIYGKEPTRARIELHGSFHATSEGHGTKLALVAGLLGMLVDDVDIVNSIDIAKQRGYTYEFTDVDLVDAHPNTAVFHLGEGENTTVVQGSSVGGGGIKITHINGYEVRASGTLPAILVLHQDQPGAVSAVTSTLAAHNVNIANMRLSREKRGHTALMLIKTDSVPVPSLIDELREIDLVSSVTFVPTV